MIVNISKGCQSWYNGHLCRRTSLQVPGLSNDEIPLKYNHYIEFGSYSLHWFCTLQVGWNRYKIHFGTNFRLSPSAGKNNLVTVPAPLSNYTGDDNTAKEEPCPSNLLKLTGSDVTYRYILGWSRTYAGYGYAWLPGRWTTIWTWVEHSVPYLEGNITNMTKDSLDTKYLILDTCYLIVDA